jgi:hypothetical protein
MLLRLSNDEVFAVGAVEYLYSPATAKENTNRIIIPIMVEIDKKIPTQAVLDTGAPYAILAPAIAKAAGFTTDQALERIVMNVRGMRLEGCLTRLNITLQATQGDDLTIDTTTFIPDSQSSWGEFPSFLGLAGFLERVRFAIDPNTDQFYFGSL